MIGVGKSDVAQVVLPSYAVGLVLHHARMKAETVGNGGAHWTAPSTYHKSKKERQITGYLGECAVFVYQYGVVGGLIKFHQQRSWHNTHPTHHDKGNDFEGIDIKTRRVIKDGPKANWHKNPIRKNILNFECIIRPEHVYGPDHRYLLVVLEYPDDLLDDVSSEVVANIIGWGFFRDSIHYPNGQPGIGREHYVINASNMYSVGMLKGEPTVR